MNTQVAEIALMFVLPLGITFVTILMSASAATRNQKLLGTLLSLFLVAIDCIFYFMKNTIVTYNTDGGVLLAFASMFLFGILYVIRSEDSAAKAGNSIFAALMLVGFIGIAYWERPTLIITSDKSASEIAELNAKYQDYIQSFSNGEAAKEVGTSGTVVRTGTHLSTGHASTTETYENAKPGSPEAAKGRLNSYINETDKVIERMQSIPPAQRKRSAFRTHPGHGMPQARRLLPVYLFPAREFRGTGQTVPAGPRPARPNKSLSGTFPEQHQ